MDLSALGKLIEDFSIERDWTQFHSIRNLILAIVGEVGELAEIVQWIPDTHIETFLSNPENFQRLQDELADVLIYVMRLASISGIDIEEALVSKLDENEKKYPVEKSKGSSAKYNQLGN